jgi:hypothetical protein
MLYVTVHKALASVELFLSPMLTSGPRRQRSKVEPSWNRLVGMSHGRLPVLNTESMNHSKENSTCLKSGAHNAPNRCSGAKVVLKARTVMPALRPARIPAGVSSTTTQRSYRTPRRSAAFKYPSGSGFPRTTSSPLMRSGGTGRPAHSSLTVANALLAEVTTAH